MSNEVDLKQRDILTLRALGSFFALLGILVTVSMFQSLGNARAVVVSLASGLALLAIGVGMLFVARRMQQRTKNQSGD